MVVRDVWADLGDGALLGKIFFWGGGGERAVLFFFRDLGGSVEKRRAFFFLTLPAVASAVGWLRNSTTRFLSLRRDERIRENIK